MYIRSTELLGCFFSWSRLSPQYMTRVSTDGFFPFMPSRNFLRSNRSCHPLSSFHDSQGELGYLDGITPLDVVVAGAGAGAHQHRVPERRDEGVRDAAGGGRQLERSGPRRGVVPVRRAADAVEARNVYLPGERDRRCGRKFQLSPDGDEGAGGGSTGARPGCTGAGHNDVERGNSLKISLDGVPMPSARLIPLGTVRRLLCVLVPWYWLPLPLPSSPVLYWLVRPGQTPRRRRCPQRSGPLSTRTRSGP